MKSIKSQVRNILERSPLYYRVRSSVIQDVYWRLTARHRIAEREKQIDFYRQFLSGFRPGDLIFDVGANVGFKVDIFLRLGARVVAMEPDATNQSILRNSFLNLRLARKPVVIVGKAVSNRIAVETMWIDGPGSAVNTLSPKWAAALKENKARHQHGHWGLDFEQSKTVETTTLETLIATYGLPIFVKIDVEGHELNVIRGLTRPVPYLSFEVNFPDFKSEALQCVDLLRGLAPDGKFNYAVNCEEGFALDQWLAAPEFARVLEHCTESCVEVFWRGQDAPAVDRVPEKSEVAG